MMLIPSHSSLGQEPIVIAGNPKGDLRTELLQAITAARSMESTLNQVIKKYPALKLRAVAAQAAWQYSPFARGARYIEEDIKKKAGQKGKDLISTIDKTSADVVRTYVPVETLEKAREFLGLVEERAKGEIEIPMVRGMLLWNCPEYQDKPEKEILDGYVVDEVSEKDTVAASAEWPMSWKQVKARNPKILQKFQSHWGHGKLSGMLRIDTIPYEKEGILEPNEIYDQITQADMEAEAPGMQFFSFKKTRHNGLPAILTVTNMEVEQLGVRISSASITLYVYHRNRCASIACLVPALPDDDVQALLKTHEPLMMAILSSFRVSFPKDSDSDVKPKLSKVDSSRGGPSKNLLSAGYEIYHSPDFHFAVKMPKDVVVAKATTAFGLVGNHKSVDENRGSIHSVTVNRIDAFVKEEQRRGVKMWEGLIDANFGGWTKELPIEKTTLKTTKTRRNDCQAIRYSFQCRDLLEPGTTTYHSGITFLYAGSFYNLCIISMIGEDEAAEDLVGLENSFMTDVSIKTK